VRLLDILAEGAVEGRPTRRLVETFAMDGDELAWWCFGLPWADVGRRVQAWRNEGWQPDEVWVTTLASIWQRGAQEVIRRVKYDWWPQARVVLGGVYPTLYPDHAVANSDADLIVTGPVPEAAPSPDYSLYAAMPPNAGVYLYGGGAPDDVIREIVGLARRGVREISFFDDDLPGPDPGRFDYVLDNMARLKLKLRPVILGNLHARGVTEYRATLLHALNASDVFLSWDPALNGDFGHYLAAAEMLHTFGGLKPRDGSLNALVYAGWPGERLEDTTAHLLHLAHAAGSVTVFPYQPTPEEGHTLGIGEPDRLNGKLFPFAAANGARFADYADLFRLAATLNSKYRDVTFDFLGDDLVARMVRSSIRQRLWQPPGVHP
jgi:hypothetical protein